jgi:hypothetical protein
VFEGKTILVAPLDWGLGHASRCVPLIKQLTEKNKVIVGVTTITSPFLNAYFPHLPQVEFVSYNVRYHKYVPQWLNLLFQVPSTLRVIKKEKAQTQSHVDKYGINVIISDNRYGVYHKKAVNIFISHQVNLQLPFFSRFMSNLQERRLRSFSEIWIPDYADREKSLGGKLSDASSLKINHRYIGPLSAIGAQGQSYEILYDYLFLLSGPEPQRTILEAILLRHVAGKNKRIAFVRGISDAFDETFAVDVQKGLCVGAELAGLIKASSTIVCRSGYSTLMDLHLIGKKQIILIPTPGQPEQEYLAEHWRKNFGATVIKQNSLGKSALWDLIS